MSKLSSAASEDETDLLNFLHLLEKPVTVAKQHGIAISKNMFRKPNPKALESILHSLFIMIHGESQATKEFKLIWPIKNNKQQKDFQQRMQDWLKELRDAGHLETLPPSPISLLRTAQGARLVTVLVELCQVAILQDLHRLDPELAEVAPRPACDKDLRLVAEVGDCLLRVDEASLAQLTNEFMEPTKQIVGSQAEYEHAAKIMTERYYDLMARISSCSQQTEAHIMAAAVAQHPEASLEELAGADTVDRALHVERLWEQVVQQQGLFKRVAELAQQIGQHHVHPYAIDGMALKQLQQRSTGGPAAADSQGPASFDIFPVLEAWVLSQEQLQSYILSSLNTAATSQPPSAPSLQQGGQGLQGEWSGESGLAMLAGLEKGQGGKKGESGKQHLDMMSGALQLHRLNVERLEALVAEAERDMEERAEKMALLKEEAAAGRLEAAEKLAARDYQTVQKHGYCSPARTHLLKSQTPAASPSKTYTPRKTLLAAFSAAPPSANHLPPCSPDSDQVSLVNQGSPRHSISSIASSSFQSFRQNAYSMQSSSGLLHPSSSNTTMLLSTLSEPQLPSPNQPFARPPSSDSLRPSTPPLPSTNIFCHPAEPLPTTSPSLPSQYAPWSPPPTTAAGLPPSPAPSNSPQYPAFLQPPMPSPLLTTPGPALPIPPSISSTPVPTTLSPAPAAVTFSPASTSLSPTNFDMGSDLAAVLSSLGAAEACIPTTPPTHPSTHTPAANEPNRLPLTESFNRVNSTSSNPLHSQPQFLVTPAIVGSTASGVEGSVGAAAAGNGSSVGVGGLGQASALGGAGDLTVASLKQRFLNLKHKGAIA